MMNFVGLDLAFVDHVALKKTTTTVVLLENCIAVRITEQYKRMEVITQQLYVPHCIKAGWYSHQRSQTVPRKNTPDPHWVIMALCSSHLITLTMGS
ncbi:hypothetical protein TNCV_137021 [Trichonephila clavipes]|nr:hypothetical protein TNCV_137021 [Trichonephila clavipes]